MNDNNDYSDKETSSPRRFSILDKVSATSVNNPVLLIRCKLNAPGNRDNNSQTNTMSYKDRFRRNLLRSNTTSTGGEVLPSSSGSAVCQRCHMFEVDLTNTSDSLSATDAELKASRQVISLLQRQLELFRVEKEGLEKLVVSQSNSFKQKVDETSSSNDGMGDTIFLDDDILQLGVDDAETTSSTQVSLDDIQKRLLKLIKTQLYAKDEEIVKLKLSLKESQNEKEQMSVQRHMLEDEIVLLRENLALRDQTIVSLSNEVFEQSNPTSLVISQRRQSTLETSTNPSANVSRLYQKQVDKLNETLEAYKKTNELLSQNVLKLTDRCATIEKREMETKSQAQELEARCCQIQSKLLSLLKEIEQSSKQASDENNVITGDEFIQSEPVKLLIKRLLEDKSLDIPLSWKEGNRTRDKTNEDSCKQICDELGFYIVPTDKNRVLASNSVNNQKVRQSLRRGGSKGTHMLHLMTDGKAGDADELEKNLNIGNQTLQHSVDSLKSDETNWRLSWDEFIKDFDRINLSKSKELKNLLRSGVPQEYRCKIWKSLIDLKIGSERSSYGSEYYQSLLQSSQSASNAKQPSSKQIELDLLRTLPSNKYFESIDSPGTVRLRRVLTAFAAHEPQIGYCQGMNRLAAVALLVLPEEEAFWCLVSIVDKIMPTGYYNDLWLAQVDSNVVMDFVSIMMPNLFKHFQAHEIELSLFAWFLTIFVDGTPPTLFLRLWDCFLYEGDKIMFRVALALLKMHEDQLMELNSSVAVNSFLRTVVNSPMDIDEFFHIAFHSINPLPGRVLRSKREINFQAMRSTLRTVLDSGASVSPHAVVRDQDDESTNEDSSIISV